MNGLKYKVPSILELKSRMLNDEQIGFLKKIWIMKKWMMKLGNIGIVS